MWVIRKRSKCKTCQGSYADILQPRHGKPAFYFNFLRNVASAGAARRVVPLPLATTEAARVVDYLGWRPELVYVDASHDAIDVLQDLEHFYYLLACGGALVGDDYHWTQVRLAVDWFAHHRRLQLRVFEIFGGGTNAERVVPVRLVGGARTFQGESNRGGASGSTINSKWLIGSGSSPASHFSHPLVWLVLCHKIHFYRPRGYCVQKSNIRSVNCDACPQPRARCVLTTNDSGDSHGTPSCTSTLF